MLEIRKIKSFNFWIKILKNKSILYTLPHINANWKDIKLTINEQNPSELVDFFMFIENGGNNLSIGNEVEDDLKNAMLKVLLTNNKKYETLCNNVGCKFVFISNKTELGSKFDEYKIAGIKWF